MKSATLRFARWGAWLMVATATAFLDSRGAQADEAGLHWVPAHSGEVPPGAIVGGSEPGRTLYVCHAWHGRGWQPGKVVGSNCNIGYGGKELTIESYEVLVGDNSKVSWVDASDGYVPFRGFSGGSEPGRPNLYVCRAYHNGWQPGKVVGSNCNIGYGGNELTLNPYQVLVPNP